MNGHIFTALGGITTVFESKDKREIDRLILIIRSCGHGHHFAVIGEGHRLAVNDSGVECIKAKMDLPEVTSQDLSDPSDNLNPMIEN